MEFDIYQVAAFTRERFGGNPAAVVPLKEWIDAALMQKIAAENNLSETAFFVPTGVNEWHIRWFTPKVEVPLCGHATLATAAVIRSKLEHNEWPITLQSASGPLLVDIESDAFVLDLPADKPVTISLLDGLQGVLGAPVRESYTGRDLHLVILDDEATVAKLQPDFAALGAMIEHGVIVSAAGDQVDFVSRFFAPSMGLNEDPVTGAAHCILTPYWSNRLGKKTLMARQISSRVGNLKCEDLDQRVKLTGYAVFYLSGQISV